MGAATLGKVDNIVKRDEFTVSVSDCKGCEVKWFIAIPLVQLTDDLVLFAI